MDGQTFVKAWKNMGRIISGNGNAGLALEECLPELMDERVRHVLWWGDQEESPGSGCALFCGEGGIQEVTFQFEVDGRKRKVEIEAGITFVPWREVIDFKEKLKKSSDGWPLLLSAVLRLRCGEKISMLPPTDADVARGGFRFTGTEFEPYADPKEFVREILAMLKSRAG